MVKRRLSLLALLAPPILGGCGAVTQVKTAFEMPVQPTPSAKELARAKETRAFDSLSRSLSKLDSQTLGKYFSSGKSPSARATPHPNTAPFVGVSDPAGTLASDLRRGANIPVAPRLVAVSLSSSSAPSVDVPLLPGDNTTLALGTRTLRTGRVTADVGRQTLNEFLQGLAARASLRRTDDELLGRRALEDRIAQQARATRSTIDLSLVSPETQLELSNLRLQLLPLLSIPVARRAQAQQRIDAIEKRLNDIWEAETARQNALLQQSLVDIPAKLRQEGEVILAQNARDSAAQTGEQLARIRTGYENRLVPATLPSLNLTQPVSVAPSPNGVRTAVGARLPAQTGGRARSLPPLPTGLDIEKRGQSASALTAQRVAAKTGRVWNAATR